jgi:hypothetical protein
MVQHADIDHTGLTGISSGAVATDAIWDAAGDLAVGSGANTAARLAIGAAGGAVSRINGAVAWNSGTSFPGSAATGDRYWRTDLRMEFFYDGTRWLSTTQRVLTMDARAAHSSSGLAATATLGNMAMPNVDIYVEDFRVIAFASAGAFDGTNHWVITLDKLTTGNASTTIGTLTMNSQTSNNWKVWEVAVDAVVALSAHVVFRLVATKVLSAPNLFLASEVTYRLVGA